MSQKEPKKSNKKQKILDINHEFLINSQKIEKKSYKILRKPNNHNYLDKASKSISKARKRPKKIHQIPKLIKNIPSGPKGSIRPFKI